MEVIYLYTQICFLWCTVIYTDSLKKKERERERKEKKERKKKEKKGEKKKSGEKRERGKKKKKQREKRKRKKKEAQSTCVFLTQLCDVNHQASDPHHPLSPPRLVKMLLCVQVWIVFKKSLLLLLLLFLSVLSDVSGDKKKFFLLKAPKQ